MNKRFKLGDLVLPADGWSGTGRRHQAALHTPGIIIGKEKSMFPTKWHRLDFTVLWTGTGVIEDDICSSEIEHYKGEG